MKGGLQKQRLQERQQYNKIVSQLNQLKAAGFTPEQIRAAGSNAYNELLTAKDGDTLSTIANQVGVPPADILAANPELKTVRPGMVLNVPAPGSELWRAQNIGGLPSNAALGGATPNPQGFNGIDRSKITSLTSGGNNYLQPGSSDILPALQSVFSPANPGRNVQGGGFNLNPGRNVQGGGNMSLATTPGRNVVGGLGNMAPLTTNPGRNVIGGLGGMTNIPLNTPVTVQQAQVQTNQQIRMNPTFRTKDDYYPTQLAAQIKLLGKTPTADQLAYLEKYGMITKTQPAYSGGGGYYRNYKRYGRGGGGRSSGGSVARGGTNNEPRLPAFSTGSAFNGLVNWRIP